MEDKQEKLIEYWTNVGMSVCMLIKLYIIIIITFIYKVQSFIKQWNL